MNRVVTRRVGVSLLAAFVVSAPVAPRSAEAQSLPVRSPATGFTIGVGVAGTSVSTSTTRRLSETSRGLNFEVGWGLSPRFTVFLAATGSVVDSDLDDAVGQGEVGLRYLFRATDKKARPYAEAGIAARQVQFDFTDGTNMLTARGRSTGLLMGAGVQLFFHPRVAMDMAATITGGNLSGWTANGESVDAPDMDANSTNVRIGVRFWPGRR